MAVTATYSWDLVRFLELDSATAFADVASLSNGGFVGIGDHAGHIDGTIFSAAANATDGWINTPGVNGAVAQLTGGNIVVVSQDADSIRYEISDSAGVLLLPSVDIGDLGSSNADVAALNNGGFVIVNQDFTGGSNRHIDVRLYNSLGVMQTAFAIDQAATNDQSPSVAVLDGGNIAVAWTRTVGAETEIWNAVYTQAGATVLGPTLVDTVGGANRNVSLATAYFGGYALAYEDSGWDGDVDITLMEFSASGAFVLEADVSNDLYNTGVADNDANPYLVRLSNGYFAVAYTDNSFADSDTIVALIDPTTGQVLAEDNIAGNALFTSDVENPAAAAFFFGALAVFHTNLSNGGTDGEYLQAVRTVTGDGAADNVIGDDLIDIMNGGAGNDTLDGQGNRDTLNGGLGADTLRGGAGNDTLVGAAGADAIFGGSGVDTVNYKGSNAAVSVNLFNGIGAGGHAQGDTFNGVERVVGSNFADVLIGSTAANRLSGGAGNDAMDGWLGADELIGGGGADNFIFDAALGAGNIDTITDYAPGVDAFLLANGVFTGLAAGALAAAAFRVGASAADASDRIIYNSVSGAVYFDADGAGGAAQIQFAALGAGLALTANDFIVF